MSKTATIASLVRASARSEAEFVETLQGVFEEDDLARAAEFFDRLNIPRSTGAEGLNDDLPELDTVCFTSVTNFTEERELNAGIQKYMDRHERKIKWHAGHPSIEGAENVLLLMRGAMLVTSMRLKRLVNLMNKHEELNPQDWAAAREMMNRSYLSFRNFVNLMAGDWIDAMNSMFAGDELYEKIGNFYELVDQQIRQLEEYRTLIEDRRMELTVTPEGFPPVKPPRYFGGDLMGRGPWKQYWSQLNARAHHFRETAV